jgi:hypothetical protein
MDKIGSRTRFKIFINKCSVPYLSTAHGGGGGDFTYTTNAGAVTITGYTGGGRRRYYSSHHHLSFSPTFFRGCAAI